MSEIIILDQFKKQLISFFDELIGQFPEAPELVVLRILFKDQLPIKRVMENFIYKLISVRELIKNRDEMFFLEHNIFSFTDKDSVNNLKKIWKSGRLDKEDKDIVWNWIDSFVFLADKYSKAMENSIIVN
jgi:hypothetical protein